MSRQASLRCELLEGREVPALIGFDQLAIDSSDFDPNHVLVQWKDGAAHTTRWTQAAEDLGNGMYRLTLNSNVTVGTAIAVLQTNTAIALVQPDYRISATRTSNDTSLGTLWGLDNTGQNSGTADADIDALEAWSVSTGTKRTIVAVVDTGVDFTHPDLAANMWRNTREIPGNGVDDDGNGFKDDVFGYDFANNDGSPKDDNGHGTHVAGVIGAVGNNGVGVSGVSWNTQIMALKFLNKDASGFLSNAVRAINYAVKNGAKIINASFGGGGNDTALAAAISNAKAKGVLVVAAAGNSASNNDASAVYPASYTGDNVIAVAATDRNDKLATFSNYGKTSVDLAAPGKSIYSTLPNGRFGYYSGTSMAAPYVAGAAALVWDAHPTWTYQQVRQALLAGADRIDSLTGKVASGRLNVANAINYQTSSPPAKDTAGANISSVVFSGTGNAIDRARITFSEAINPSTFTAADLTLTAPGGAKLAIKSATVVAGTGNTQFDVVFASQSKAGNYTLVVGPNILDASGNMLNQNRNGMNGEAADKHTAVGVVSTTTTPSSPVNSSSDINKAIVDKGTVISRLTITQNVTIADLNVQVSLSHTRMADLTLTLVAPDGTRVILFNRRGGDGDNLTNTTFDDQAASSIYKGAAPFTGSFKPEYVLKSLNGKLAKGTWQLIVQDSFAGNVGTLKSWSLSINGSTTSASSIATTAKATSLVSAPPVDKKGQVFLGLSSYFVSLR